MYPIIICDDDPKALKSLNDIVQAYQEKHPDHYKLVHSSESPEEVLTYLEDKAQAYSLYLLDYDFDNSSMTGLDLALKIREQDDTAKIIFVSSMESAAGITARHHVEAVRFIDKIEFDELKVELEESLLLTYERLLAASSDDEPTITIRVGTKDYIFPLSEVFCIQTSGVPHKLNLHALNGTFPFYDKLKNFQQTYPQLVRISRFCLVNPDKISAIDRKEHLLILDNQIQLPFTRGYEDNVNQLFE